MCSFPYSPASNEVPNAAQIAAPKAPKGGFWSVEVVYEWDKRNMKRPVAP